MLFIKKTFGWIISVLVVGLLIGLFGNHIYYKIFQAPELSYMIRTYSVFAGIRTQNDQIKLFMNEEPVEKLYLTTMKIENTGGVAFERTDFSAEKSPLRIIGPDIKSVFIDEHNSNFNSEAHIIPENGYFLVQFKWLNPGEHITVNILHDKFTSKMELQGGFANLNSVKEVSFKNGTLRSYMSFVVLSTLLSTLTFLLGSLILLIVNNKRQFGVFWLTFIQRFTYLVIVSCRQYTKKEKKRIIKDIISTKDKDKLQKILDKYCKNKVAKK